MMPFDPHKLSVYLVMGSQDCRDRDPIRVLEQAIAGGITLFQFREKGSRLTLSETVSLGRQLREVCAAHHIPFIVNDRVDLALILDADGVHIGQEDLPAPEVRRLIGDERWLGVSCETPSEAEEARTAGANYIGVGAMYATRSKADAGEPIGPEAIAEIRRTLSSPLPMVGIGGITPRNAPEVIRSGADGVAVISAIAGSPDPRQAAEQLKNAVKSAKGQRV